MGYSRKNGNFSTFWTSCLIAKKHVFSFSNVEKHIFLAFIAKKKKWKNGQFLTKTMD